MRIQVVGRIMIHMQNREIVSNGKLRKWNTNIRTLIRLTDARLSLQLLDTTRRRGGWAENQDDSSEAIVSIVSNQDDPNESNEA